MNKLHLLVVLAVGLFLLIQADNLISNESRESAQQSLQEALYERMKHPESPVSHCFPNGTPDRMCVRAWWDSVWMHPNLKAGQLAWGSCREKINRLDPEWFTDPWNKIEITQYVNSRGWPDGMSSKAEANENANELIRHWNDTTPGLNCGLAR